MKRLNVAVIGFGVMGSYHANVYAALPHTNLVAIVDPSAERQNVASNQHDVPAYNTIDEMLSNHAVHAVSIASPTSLHYDLTKYCLQQNLHVLVEKPVATNTDHARELMELSREYGLILQVGHITRFYRAVQLLKERVYAPYFIEARRLSPVARVQDVGVILDLMIHDIDIVLGIVPYDIAELTISGHMLSGTDCEDVAAAQVVFENGCIARFLASRISPVSERSFVISEEQQSFRLDFGKEPHTEVAVYKSQTDEHGSNQVQVNKTNVLETNPLRRELEHFLDRIHQENIIPIGTLEDDLRSLSLATTFIKELHKKQRTPSFAVA